MKCSECRNQAFLPLDEPAVKDHLLGKTTIGTYAWIFFAEPVPARLARVLGTLLLSRTTEQRQTLGIRSFDRFFPSQDFLPTKRHGFGNLIALPLQKVPRDNKNSVFLDAQMKIVHRQPLLDQWKARLQQFLTLGDIRIGVITGTKQNPGGKIDIAMIQSLVKNPDLPALAARYSQVIVDECHRIPAISFEGLSRRSRRAMFLDSRQRRIARMAWKGYS